MLAKTIKSPLLEKNNQKFYSNNTKNIFDVTSPLEYITHVKNAKSLLVVLFFRLKDIVKVYDKFKIIANDLAYKDTEFASVNMDAQVNVSFLEGDVYVSPTVRFFINSEPVADLVGYNSNEIKEYIDVLKTSNPASLIANAKDGPSLNLSVFDSISLSPYFLNNTKLQVDTETKANRLGKGSYGTVWLGLYVQTRVAVKMYKGDSSNDLAKTKAFLKEAHAMMSLHHPRLVQMIGICKKETKWCLVLELMAASLTEVIKSKEYLFSQEMIISYLLEIAEGLAYMHSKNIGHFDLKPDNVMIDPENHAKLADFGFSTKLSKLVGFDIKHGSPLYAAPELFVSKTISTKADIFSFAMLSYFVVFGKDPYYDVKNLNLKLTHHGSATFRPSLPSKISKDLRNFFEMCWEHDPDKRPDVIEIITFLKQRRLSILNVVIA